MAAVAISFGLVALVASQVATRGSSPVNAGAVQLAQLDDETVARAANPTKAESTTGIDAPLRQSIEPSRQPPPPEAQPITRLSGLDSRDQRTDSATANDYPFSAIIVSSDDTTGGLAADVAASLSRRGIAARNATLAVAGRPDVLVMLETAASLHEVDAWYCSPGAEGSALLATALLTGVQAEEAPVDPGGGETPPDPDLRCAEVQEGRASTAAVLLRLPEHQLTDDAAESISLAALAYFSDNAATVRAARSTRLVWPASGPVTSHYGPDHPLGIDIGQWDGDIVAATDGVVVFAGGDACCSYGIYVVIEGSGGFQTIYGHLETLKVKRGDRVKQGQALGKVGCTGHCFGIHLHFEVFKDGVRQDPLRFLP